MAYSIKAIPFDVLRDGGKIENMKRDSAELIKQIKCLGHLTSVMGKISCVGTSVKKWGRGAPETIFIPHP